MAQRRRHAGRRWSGRLVARRGTWSAAELRRRDGERQRRKAAALAGVTLWAALMGLVALLSALGWAR